MGAVRADGVRTFLAGPMVERASQSRQHRRDSACGGSRQFSLRDLLVVLGEAIMDQAGGRSLREATHGIGADTGRGLTNAIRTITRSEDTMLGVVHCTKYWYRLSLQTS